MKNKVIQVSQDDITWCSNQRRFKDVVNTPEVFNNSVELTQNGMIRIGVCRYANRRSSSKLPRLRVGS